MIETLERQALVRAAMLLSEARDLVKEGPTTADVPLGAVPPLVRFWNPSDKKLLEDIDSIPDERKRFVARVKFITGESRPDRAEEAFSEMLGEWAKEDGQSDVAAYKQQYRERLKRVIIKDIRTCLLGFE
jgi:hypothetical protein